MPGYEHEAPLRASFGTKAPSAAISRRTGHEKNPSARLQNPRPIVSQRDHVVIWEKVQQVESEDDVEELVVLRQGQRRPILSLDGNSPASLVEDFDQRPRGRADKQDLGSAPLRKSAVHQELEFLQSLGLRRNNGTPGGL